ncbi:helix-turn-helix domain-containing protein [Streptomyces gardneri]|uniref:helix-turn-helix domain-containing protein n=1 Tax=Streptomyces gardneri TaxID=66892 RepID=UPI00368D64F8
MTTPSHADRLRLAKLVIHRRRELGWHKVDAAKAAGLTHTTYMRAETGQPVRDVTYAAIEKAFAWAPGACHAVLDGLEEAPLAGDISGGARFAPAINIDETARKAVQDVVIAVTPEMPAGKMAELEKGIVEMLRQRGVIPPEGE